MTVRCQLCPSTSWIMPTPITQVFPNEPSLETLINRKEVQEFHIKRTKHSFLALHFSSSKHKNKYAIDNFLSFFHGEKLLLVIQAHVS